MADIYKILKNTTVEGPGVRFAYGFKVVKSIAKAAGQKIHGNSDVEQNTAQKNYFLK